MLHQNSKVQSAIDRLQDALIEWERDTGRASVFILRESDFIHRSLSGKPCESDLSDTDFLNLVFCEIEEEKGASDGASKIQ